MGGGSSTINKIYVKNNYLIKEIIVDDVLENIYRFEIKELTQINYTDKEWEEIKKEKYKDIDFCILNNNLNGIDQCMGLFPKGTRELDQFAFVKSSVPCKTYFFRPGLVFVDPNNSYLLQEESMNLSDGVLCRIVFRDYSYNDSEQQRCCFSNNNSKCNANLVNGYKTSHCNVVMQKTCKENELDPKCILWLENTYERNENVALEFYSDYCSNNHSSLACNYLCKVARENNDYRSAFCDKALETYCQKYSFDSNCFCVITPSNIVPEMETYLGPKECWLSPCSSQSDSKWLTTSQIDTRQQCVLTSCIITIENLTLKDNAKAKLINNCISGTNVNSSYNIKKKNEIKKIQKTPGILLYPNIAILGFALILLLK